MPDAPIDYTAQALRTESPITPALQTRLKDHARLVHAVLGLQTEAGELADPVKKHIYYGRPLDLVNLREEIGDCLWYLAIAADALGTTLEAEQARNLAKLRARYPHVFTAEAAQVRDLDREREVLEEADVAPPQIVPEIDPNPAEPRMVIWSTLRCLELQIDQHEELYDSHGVVSWELLKHMVRLAKRHAHEEGGKAQAAERETDQWRTRADEANAKLRETEQELQRLRKVHMEFQSEELTEARATIADLQQQLDAARQTILAQKRGIQYLRLLIDKVRGIVGRDDAMSERLEQISQALDEFDDGTIEPTPSSEVERLQTFVQKARKTISRTMNYCDVEFLLNALAELDAEPTPVAEPARCPECERLRAVIDQAWQRIQQSISHADVAGLLAALAEIQSNSSVTITSSPAPVTEPLDAEDGK